MCKLFKNIIACLIVLGSFFVFASSANAASRTWDGGGTTGSWSDCNNWSSNICPTAADTITFNATSIKDAIVDAAFSGTTGSVTLAAGYTGTVTQERDLTLSGVATFTQADGVYDAGAHNLTIGYNLLINGGSFIASSNNTTIHAGINIDDGSYFNHNNGTLTLLQYSGSRSGVTCNDAVFNRVVINGVKSIRTGCTLPLGHNPHINSSPQTWPGLYLDGGTLTGTGILSVGDPSTTHGLNFTGDSAITGFTHIETGRISASANTVLDLSGMTVRTRGLTQIVTGATLIAPDYLTIGDSSGAYFTTDTTSTFEHNNGTVEFIGPSNVINGSNTFYNLKKVATQTSILTFAADSTQTILGTLTLEGMDEDSLLSLVSSNPGTQWNINASGPQNLNFLSVEDSNSTGDPLYAANSTFLGDTTNWSLPLPEPTAETPKPVSGSLAKSGLSLPVMFAISFLVIFSSAAYLITRKQHA